MGHALIVDDDTDAAEMLAELAVSQGFTAATARTMREAKRQLVMNAPDVVFLDLMLPDGKGTELFEDKSALGNTEVVLITGHASLETSIEALRLGAADYLIKPVTPSQVTSVLSRVMRPAELQAEITDLQEEMDRTGRFGEMWGTSEAMRRVYEQVSRVAGTAVTVLIEGESGTGKELVAQLDPRAEPSSQPTVPRNQLRRDVAAPDRKRDLRPRERQLHRRRSPAPGLLRARAWRHAVPRRDHRDAAGAAGQAAARARNRHLHARRIDRYTDHRRARDRRDQPHSGARRSRRASCAKTCCTA